MRSEGYNTSNYPVYSSISNPNNDCANFASQCLQAGGKAEAGSNYTSASSWFCNTTSSSQLTLCSLTWRYAPSFKAYWSTRCNSYKAVREYNADSYTEFRDNIWLFLYYGDIIQLADSGGAPYHTMICTSYNVNGQTDIGYTAHTVNRLDQSLYGIMENSSDLVLLYHFVDSE